MTVGTGFLSVLHSLSFPALSQCFRQLLQIVKNGFFLFFPGNKSGILRKVPVEYKSDKSGMLSYFSYFCFTKLKHMNTKPKTDIHHGRNIKRLREMLGVKQEAVAFDLNMSQQLFSDIEKREILEETMINKIAHALKVPAEAIKNMTEESVMNYIYNFNNNKVEIENGGIIGNHNSPNWTFNPIDKIVELYERMLTLEREKNALLEEKAKEKKS